ncbi:MAG: hypothetical protein IJF37_10450 [Lachnospiraceae bacterium]|nr:hypothetical protein [Lachnospiraceae bacterium]
MWTEEDEEKYIDLLNIYDLLAPKRTVKGDFQSEIYVVDKKVEFENYTFFNGEMSIYLPKGCIEGHCEDEIFNVQQMDEYVEFVSEDKKFVFIIERGTKESLGIDKEEYVDLEDFYDDYIDELERKNGDIEANKWEEFFIDKGAVNVFRVMIENGEVDFYGYIYFIYIDDRIFRFYIGSKIYPLDVVGCLGKKIVQNGIFQEG